VTAVGFIGLGTQGAPMAEAIAAAGHKLTVWARRPDVVRNLAVGSASIATGPKELASISKIVCLCVTDDNAVQEVVLDNGLLDAMTPGSVLVVHSTIHPALCRTVGRAAAAMEVETLDAPVSGGAAAARTRSLTVMVGGARSALDQAADVFDSYAARVVHVGDLGAALVVKLMNNALFSANVGLAAEVERIGLDYGIAVGTVRELILASSGASEGLRALPIIARDAHLQALLRKDLALLGDIDGVSSLAELTRQAFEHLEPPPPVLDELLNVK
jgi:3-hydroxyisobutyrate dehydrogenase